MLDYIDKLENHFKGDVNLHTHEITKDEGGAEKIRAVRSANRTLGLLLYEHGKNNWRPRSYFNLRAGWDKAERFTEVDLTPPGFFRRLVALSREEGAIKVSSRACTARSSSGSPPH
jgi:hypothetical protein